jgi:hypothetical protein
MRITKNDLTAMFERLVKAMKQTIAIDNESGLYLDYAPYYGGYKIVEFEEGIENEIFGNIRRSKTEMYYSMLMTAQALEDLQNLGKYNILNSKRYNERIATDI